MSAATPDNDSYALKSSMVAQIEAPELDYRPPMPRAYRPRIGVIGAGGIVAAHLEAYRSAGWEVAAICNRTISKAQARADEFYPKAQVSSDPDVIFADPLIDVVDITPHPADRLPLIEAAIRAGKHVLSQKPFVLDIAQGRHLADLADSHGVKLAVNQNGRWAPHMAWMRQAVLTGHIGDLISCHTAVHWNHGWIKDTPFDEIEDLILYDFGIHWFDFLASLIGERAKVVTATSVRGLGQRTKAPLSAQVQIALDQGQASLVFDGGTPFGAQDTTFIGGTKGSLRSQGPDLGAQTITLTTAQGQAQPKLEGTWFNDGFRGAMGALLVAIEDDIEPSHGARGNLRSLELAFAAIQARRLGRAVDVGSVTKLDT